ncbi:hypothetical protein NDU88_004601 [Pleurodeles waltl]|uniref:Uncharacterized protein n=1 Tax=Pleurodeles waltl TaxID=8319 RepID=A0AAV7LKA2_PLEWA|nr:hypothetical protein NDU88_004601 [Pleurodeles waltl]
MVPTTTTTTTYHGQPVVGLAGCGNPHSPGLPAITLAHHAALAVPGWEGAPTEMTKWTSRQTGQEPASAGATSNKVQPERAKEKAKEGADDKGQDAAPDKPPEEGAKGKG